MLSPYGDDSLLQPHAALLQEQPHCLRQFLGHPRIHICCTIIISELLSRRLDRQREGFPKTVGQTAVSSRITKEGYGNREEMVKERLWAHNLLFFISERSRVELTRNGYARTVLQNGHVLGMIMPIL